MKKIRLPLSALYVNHWSIYDALRELFQNGIDREHENNESKLFYSYNEHDKSFRIGNSKTTIGIETLVLGNTKKTSNSEALGNFGEGYKLALIVLLRNNLDVKIYNGAEIWTPKFEWSEEFKCRILTIEITENNDVENNDFFYQLDGLRSKVYHSYSIYNLHLQPNYISDETIHGQILYDERFKGKIFVEGLYVCSMSNEFYYGYNFKAGVVPLNRDRNKLSSWDVSWEASRMLGEIGQTEKTKQITELIEKSSKDIEYLLDVLDSKKIQPIADGCFDRYINIHGNVIPAADESEKKQLQLKYENIKVLIEKENYVNVMKKSYKYKKLLESYVIRNIITPKKRLVIFLEKNKELFPKKLIQIFLAEIINRSNNWEEK